MNKSVFIDFDALVSIDSKVWIVDRKRANVPILKISKSDFNLIKSGIYKNQGNKIDFNGETFWLPTSLWNSIKIKIKNYGSNLSDVAISMQEFLNSELIDTKDFELNTKLMDHLMNDVQDIYVICSRQIKDRYKSLIEKVKLELQSKGLKITNFYYISENFSNQNDDDIRFKKIRLLLQHLIGYRTVQDHFDDEDITKYEMIHYYDTSTQTLSLATEINNTLEFLMSRTDEGLRNVIKEDIEDFRPILWCHKINSNQVNWMENKKVLINLSKIITTFENFNPLT